MRLVPRGDNPNKETSSIYHIPHFTINWAYTTRVVESWDVSSVVLSCYVCRIMISTGVKSVVCLLLLLELVLLRCLGMCPSVPITYIHIRLVWGWLLEVDEKSRYHVHNGSRICPRQQPHMVGYGPQPTPLGANSIGNSRINSGSHYTILELLWPQVAPNSVATSSHYEDVLLEIY